ncbi:MAG: nickel-dependent hydrogenase large subunit [Acidobacteriaceae bacterium]|nr:nickel-dependent hydrogenase large subunit [Acidobacteriaceae bacterium]
MSSAATGEGSIHILLHVENARIEDVTISNHRPLSLPVQLAGFTLEDAVRRVAMLYSVCRVAQGIAACTAVEQARGIEVSPAQKTARALLLCGETVLEHATCALLNWPVLLGKRPAAIAELKIIRANLAELWRSLYPSGDWNRPGGGRLIPNPAELAARIDGIEDALFHAGLPISLEEGNWRTWSDTKPGPLAEIGHSLMENGWERCGASRVALLDLSDTAALGQRMAADDAFIAEPDWRGVPAETGPLVRRHAEPVLQDAIAEYGEGLLVRFLAQCVDTMCSLREMRELAGRLCVDEGMPNGASDGVGFGVVGAARGVLAHRVEIADGHIRRYQILAPTEWNFHPRGALARGLRGMSGVSLKTFAHLMVAAFDPCVSCQIDMC